MEKENLNNYNLEFKADEKIFSDVKQILEERKIWRVDIIVKGKNGKVWIIMESKINKDEYKG